MINIVQKVILVLGAVAVIGLMLFPPWKLGPNAIAAGADVGRHLVGWGQAEVNTEQLLVEVLGVAIAAWLLCAAARRLSGKEDR